MPAERLKQWIRISWIVITSLCTVDPARAADTARPALRELSLPMGFTQPPAAARPSAYYLMLNGYLNEEHVDRELEALVAKGVRGLCLFDMGGRGPAGTLPPAGPPFMSDAWLDPFARIVRKAGELGMEAQLAVSSSWDMGASWVQPKDASMALYHSAYDVEGPRALEVSLPRPDIPNQAPRDEEGRPRFLQEIAVVAVPGGGDAGSRVIANRDAILDLTGHLDENGRLRWSVPEGSWTIFRFVCGNTGERLKVPSPASDGLATDHFNAEVTRAYVRHVIGRLQSRLGDLRQTALKQLYLPSYEVRGRVWTPDLLDQFRKYRGYDMTRYLPALIGYTVESREVTQDFLHDFRKTMGDLLVDAYYRAAGEAAREAGLGVEAEAGGPGPPVHQVPVDALKALGAIDEMRGEFWPWRLTNDPLWVVKETACAAHVYGRRRVHMESFTGFYHWESGPFDLKFSADRAFCEGMNHVVWHTSSHQPPEAGQPGWVYGAGTHLTPNLIWWPHAQSFLDYLARCSFLLQQGLFVADICHYYGDQGYNFVPPKHVNPSLGFGYDYDVANAEVILERMSVRDGRFVLPDGMSYALLTLPEREDIDVGVLRQVAALVEQGGTVMGPKPVRAPGLFDRVARDRQVRELADALWGEIDGESVFENRYGKGKIVWGRTLREVLQARGIGPDFQFTGDEERAELDYIHRRTEEADIYFIRNVGKHWVSAQAEFRVTGKSPEIWSPDTGRITPQPVFTRTPGGTRLPLRLAPWGSVFVVFRDRGHGPAIAEADPRLELEAINDVSVRATSVAKGVFDVHLADGSLRRARFDDVPNARTLAGPWAVRLVSPWDEETSVTLEALQSWTDHDRDDIRHFSGVAHYAKEFEVPGDWLGGDSKLFLDLGGLWAVGEVFLNDRSQGVLWKPPYRLDITAAARPGPNRLEVAVANTWANRLIGDAQLPQEERRTRTNIARSGGKSWKEKPLLESGLLGPVRLIPARTRIIDLPAP